MTLLEKMKNKKKLKKLTGKDREQYILSRSLNNVLKICKKYSTDRMDKCLECPLFEEDSPCFIKVPSLWNESKIKEKLNNDNS